MLIYLIIAAELAILYTVFWYVYVRDPKPYKIVGNLWGRYEEDSLTASGASPVRSCITDKHKELLNWWQSQTPSYNYPDHVQHGSASHFSRPAAQAVRRAVARRYPIRHALTCTKDKPSTPDKKQGLFLSHILTIFNRALGGLNVKVPLD